jgi:hypothetical protein
MKQIQTNREALPELIGHIDSRFRPVWEGKPVAYQQALARYFLPSKSKKAVLCPTRPVFRAGSWRLPSDIQTAVTAPLKELCRHHGVQAKCCQQNLIETP